MTRILFTLCLLFPFLSFAQPAADVEKSVNHLLHFIARSDAIFIRNGSEYTGKQASDHLRKKYEHFKKEIKTPEDFIRLAATKSATSGKPYVIRLKGGREIPSAEWLTGILREFRGSKQL
ncbi:MAG: hypothetical protein JWM68_5395 [Verrucomicrobiales bacterium]|nr:hypothetical protein [Verrucomicrobiales bacterium]